MTAKPFYHPLIVVLSIVMVGLGLWFLAQGVYNMAAENMLANEMPGSFGAQADQKDLNENYVTDWPAFIGGTVWMSLFGLAVVMSLVHGRLAFLSRHMRAMNVDLVLTEQDVKDVTAWLEQSRMPLDRLKEIW
jgi:hypothetical protein